MKDFINDWKNSSRDEKVDFVMATLSLLAGFVMFYIGVWIFY